MRRSELKPGTNTLKRSPMRSKVKPTGPRDDVVDAVLERAGYSCELCTSGLGDRRGIDYHLHHRRPRRSGGDRRLDTNLPPNLLVLDSGCHQIVESRRTASYRAGWLLHSNADPGKEPALIERGTRWVLLLADGCYQTVAAPARGQGYGEAL